MIWDWWVTLWGAGVAGVTTVLGTSLVVIVFFGIVAGVPALVQSTWWRERKALREEKMRVRVARAKAQADRQIAAIARESNDPADRGHLSMAGREDQ